MQLRVYPDPILTKVSVPVDDFDGLDTFCDDLYDIMVEYGGAGLSAVQVGVLKRIIVMEVHDRHTFINPELREISLPLFKFSEGCLSVPGFYEDRDRFSSILLRYETPNKEVKVEWFHGLEAFCIQHEMDHLEGKLFIDDLSPLKKERISKKIQKNLRRK